MNYSRQARGFTILVALLSCQGLASAGQTPSGSSTPVARIPLPSAHYPSHQWSGNQNSAPGKRGSFLNRFLDAAVKNSDPEAAKAQTAPESAPAPIDLNAQPTPLDSGTPAPAAATTEGTAPSTDTAPAAPETPAAPAPPRTPEQIRVPNPPQARIPAPWTGLRVTQPATDEDIEAFQDAPSRQPRPSSSIVFIPIDHGDTESSLAPPNRSREMIDFAGQARAAAPRRPASSSDSPVLELTTTTGRSFTGRASLQGSLWRIELPSGAVINLPADRVVSTQPAPGN